MGTRHLTIVKADNKVKVAQYGQWDGYPTGQGLNIAEFLKVVDLKKFKKQVLKLGVWTDKEIDEAYKKHGHKGGEWVSMDISDKVKEEFPELSRDYGSGILQLIHEGKVKKVVLNESFKEDNLFCEYWYEIDLDEETISVHGGVGKYDGHKFKFEEWTPELMETLEKADSEE